MIEPNTQNKILAALLSDGHIFNERIDYIDRFIWASPEHQIIGDFIVEYYKKYNVKPDLSDLDNEFQDNHTLKEIRRHILDPKHGYAIDEFDRTLKNHILQKSIIDAVEEDDPDDIVSNLEQLISDMPNFSTEQHHAITKQNISTTVNNIVQTRNVVATPWPLINDLMNGGLGAGELGIFMAPTNVGKTWLLCATAIQAIKDGKNVIHFTLEDTKESIFSKYASNLLKIFPNPTVIQNRAAEIEAEMQKLDGEFAIYQFETLTHLTEIKRAVDYTIENLFKPDVIIIDYGDLARSSKKLTGEYRHVIDMAFYEIKAMAEHYKVALWSATQSNRDSYFEKYVGLHRTSESSGKNMIGNFIMTIQQTEEMRSQNKANVFIAKNKIGRTNVNYELQHYDNTTGTLIISDSGEKSPPVALDVIKENLKKHLKPKTGGLG
jgi:hypothetical protein